MSVPAVAGGAGHVYLDDAPAGLAGTLTVALLERPDQTQVAIAPTTAGIVEYPHDPSDGLSNYRATLAWPEAVGDYRLKWDSGTAVGYEDVTVGGYLGAADVVPGLEDVASLMHERLQREGGHEVDVWDEGTNPTAAQVRTIIDAQAALAMIDFGDLSDDTLICPEPGPSQIRLAARTVIAQRVAAVIELSYRTADVTGNSTGHKDAAPFWQHRVDQDTPKIAQAARECALGAIKPGGGAGEGGVSMAPVSTFNTLPRVGSQEW